LSFVGALNNAERVAYSATAGGGTTCVHALKDVCDQIRRTLYYFVTTSGSLVYVGKESDMNDRERWFDRAGVHCSKERERYMNNIRTDVLGRRAFVESDAASRTTKPGAGYDTTVASWRKDVMQSHADIEWSAL
jgi:hypothetical protein